MLRRIGDLEDRDGVVLVNIVDGILESDHRFEKCEEEVLAI